MGERNLGQWLTDLRKALQRQSLSLQEAADLVNASLREFGYAFTFAELEGTFSLETVDGTESYDPPTDFRMLRESGLVKTSPSNRVGKLKKETRDQWRRRHGDASDSNNRGDPKWYHRYGKKIYLRPIPDSTVVTIEADYWKKIVPVVAEEDRSPFSDDWDDIVFTGALYRGFRNQGEHDRYINVRNDFLGLVRSRSLEDDVEEIAQGGIEIVREGSALEDDRYAE